MMSIPMLTIISIQARQALKDDAIVSQSGYAYTGPISNDIACACLWERSGSTVPLSSWLSQIPSLIYSLNCSRKEANFAQASNAVSSKYW